MCLADCSQLSSAVPAFALTAMPFLYDSYETAGKVIFGEVGAQLDQQLEDTLEYARFRLDLEQLPQHDHQAPPHQP